MDGCEVCCAKACLLGRDQLLLSSTKIACLFYVALRCSMLPACWLLIPRCSLMFALQREGQTLHLPASDLLYSISPPPLRPERGERAETFISTNKIFLIQCLITQRKSIVELGNQLHCAHDMLPITSTSIIVTAMKKHKSSMHHKQVKHYIIYLNTKYFEII